MTLNTRIWTTIKNTSVALPISILDIFSGYIVFQILYLIEDIPQLLIIYPMILTARGGLNGILTGNISTGLHLGTIKPSFRNNTEEFHTLVTSILLLSIYTGIYIGFISNLNLFKSEISALDTPLVLLTSLNTVVLTAYISIPIAMYIAGKAFYSALDPDMILYPMTSTISDLLSSLIFTLISLGIYLLLYSYPYIVIILTVSALLPTAFVAMKYGFTEIGKDILKETFPLLTVLATISWITGNVLALLMEDIILYPMILVVFPAFATLMGDVGSIIGSITTTKLYLGELKPRINNIIELAPEILGLEIVNIAVLSIATGLSAYLTMASIPTLISIYFRLFLAQIIIMVLLCIITVGVAFITFKNGLNADNFVIPIETSSMDLLTISIIYLTITFI